MSSPRSWLLLKEAAADVGLKPVTLRAYVAGKILPRLPAELIGGRWMVEPQMFSEWKRLREKKLNQKPVSG